jgi:superfamily II DNA or RNA helicase
LGNAVAAVHHNTNEMELRAYQQDAVDNVFNSWQNFDRALGVAPTGSGKTIIFADGAARGLAPDGGRTLILAHRDELVNQAIDKIGGARGSSPARKRPNYSHHGKRRSWLPVSNPFVPSVRVYLSPHPQS